MKKFMVSVPDWYGDKFEQVLAYNPADAAEKFIEENDDDSGELSEIDVIVHDVDDGEVSEFTIEIDYEKTYTACTKGNK